MKKLDKRTPEFSKAEEAKVFTRVVSACRKARENDNHSEVDEFEEGLSGLIIAEVELNSESQEIVLPSWAGLELTNLRGWSNSSLSTMIKDVE